MFIEEQRTQKKRLRAVADELSGLAEADLQAGERRLAALEVKLEYMRERFVTLQSATERIEERFDEMMATYRQTEDRVTDLTHQLRDRDPNISCSCATCSIARAPPALHIK